MKLIEAMKKVKLNKEKIVDLQGKIAAHSANLSHETPPYGDETKNKIKEWSQSCSDLSRDNVKLLLAIQKTNIVTMVTVEVAPDTSVTQSIAAWVWRRREYAKIDFDTFKSMHDRNLREGVLPSSIPGGEQVKVTIQRHYDIEHRDKKLLEYKSEPHAIDAALEVTNATTDLIE